MTLMTPIGVLSAVQQTLTRLLVRFLEFVGFYGDSDVKKREAVGWSLHLEQWRNSERTLPRTSDREACLWGFNPQRDNLLQTQKGWLGQAGRVYGWPASPRWGERGQEGPASPTSSGQNWLLLGLTNCHRTERVLPWPPPRISPFSCKSNKHRVGVYLLPRRHLRPAVKASRHFRSLTVAETECEWRRWCFGAALHFRETKGSPCTLVLLEDKSLSILITQHRETPATETKVPDSCLLDGSDLFLKWPRLWPTRQEEPEAKRRHLIRERRSHWTGSTECLCFRKKLIKKPKCWRHDGPQHAVNHCSYLVN